MKPIVHTYTSKEPMLQVNAFIVEAEKEVVIVDTTLTMSDSKTLKKKADETGKPLAGILLTHAHPDHIAGTYNIAPDGNVPVYALESVKRCMIATEQAKHQQWSGVFGNEWIPRWIYPNVIVSDEETIRVGGMTFRVLDLGSGGDSDANSIWLLEGENPVAFLGDFVYHRHHTYMADGSILRWLANLEKYEDVLRKYPTYYVGHGGVCDFAALHNQKSYLLSYCSALLKVTQGSALLTEAAMKQFEARMMEKFPSYGCQFMINLSAEKVSDELKSA